jgi:hypothetical protein
MQNYVEDIATGKGSAFDRFINMGDVKDRKKEIYIKKLIEKNY